ncbi:hypothetical protein E4U21_004670 [Claviceps maximensis]|nr:hypothetical protein E4U21_004670 [Claviceps maximensis]
MASAKPLLTQTSRLCACNSRPLASTALHAEPFARWSSSNSRWKQRQVQDVFAREAKVLGLKSRAAFKLLEVAQERTKPRGQVIGIDLIPAQPPRGIATFQGDFLSPIVRKMVKDFIVRTKVHGALSLGRDAPGSFETEEPALDQPSYIDKERHASEEVVGMKNGDPAAATVDVVLSDMSEPWLLSSGYRSKTLTNPYRRLMNTSGMAFRDHAGSMDLCTAALQFASDTLKPGGHFVCKFYQGVEDKKFEDKLRSMFGKVVREKPESSRSESKEAYFVALRRKHGKLLQPE